MTFDATFRPLAEIAQVAPGRTPRHLDQYLKDNPRDDRSVPFFKVGDMNAESVRISRARTYLAPDELTALGATPLPAGTLIFPKAGGAIATNKKRTLAVDGVIDLNCMGVVASPEVNPEYLRLWFESIELSSLADGSILPQISKKRVSALQVPLPALEEQLWIVDILEDHLSRLDAASGVLKAVARRLVAYEASCLSASNEGVERPLADICSIQGGIQKQSKRIPVNNTYPFLRVANVTADGLDLREIHQIELFEGELERLRLLKGDLLVVEGNGSPSQIGRAALWDGSIENSVHQNHLIRLRPLPGLNPSYLEAVWNSPISRRQLTNLASSSSGLHTLSVSKLKTLTIAVPTMERQQEIVERLDDVRLRRRRLSAELISAEAKARRLRRSLLAAAFSGQLSRGRSSMSSAKEWAGV